MKIKLAAIAKDEAAYLPEWIFHHFHFGFDQIEVYVNFTTDNTFSILEKIAKNYPIKYRLADYLINQEYKVQDEILSDQFVARNPLQARAYAEMYRSAQVENFTHIMFLDIDEYWATCSFKKNIKETLKELGEPVVALFRWQNRLDEEKFGSPFRAEMRCFPSEKVAKYIIKTNIPIRIRNTHMCRPLNNIEKKYIGSHKISDPFILHRIQRSEIEYLAMLGRGDPKLLGQFGLKFNRGGYIPYQQGKRVKIPDALVNHYHYEYQEFLVKNQLADELKKAHEFVLLRADHVLNYIRNNMEVNRIARKSIRGLRIENDLVTKTQSPMIILNENFSALVNLALDLEKIDTAKCYDLLRVLHAIKPAAPTVKKALNRIKPQMHSK